MVQILQRMWNRLFGKSEYNWDIKFQVINIEKIKRDYHGSVGGLAEFFLQKNNPKGTGLFYGKDKEYIIGVSYDKRLIESGAIQKFLESYGLEVKIVKQEPFKRFFGVQYMSR